MTLTNNLTQIMPVLLNAVIDSEMDVMCVRDMEYGMSTCTDDVVSLKNKVSHPLNCLLFVKR